MNKIYSRFNKPTSSLAWKASRKFLDLQRFLYKTSETVPTTSMAPSMTMIIPTELWYLWLSAAVNIMNIIIVCYLYILFVEFLLSFWKDLNRLNWPVIVNQIANIITCTCTCKSFAYFITNEILVCQYLIEMILYQPWCASVKFIERYGVPVEAVMCLCPANNPVLYSSTVTLRTSCTCRYTPFIVLFVVSW